MSSLLTPHSALSSYGHKKKKGGSRGNGKEQPALCRAPTEVLKKQQDSQQRSPAGEDTTTTFPSAYWFSEHLGALINLHEMLRRADSYHLGPAIPKPSVRLTERGICPSVCTFF